MAPTAAEPKETRVQETQRGHNSSETTEVEELKDAEGEMGEKCYSPLLNCPSLVYSTDTKVSRFHPDFSPIIYFIEQTVFITLLCVKYRLTSILVRILQGNISYFFSYLPRLNFSPRYQFYLFTYRQVALISTTEIFPYSRQCPFVVNPYFSLQKLKGIHLGRCF